MARVSLSRRGFLAAAATGTAAAGVALAGCDRDDRPAAAGNGAGQQPQSFFGAHQMGILPGPAEYAAAVALDVTASGRDGLTGVLQTISGTIRDLTATTSPTPSDKLATPEDNGILTGHEDLLVSGTVAAGASLFDDRFGLASVKPAGLVTMPDGLARDELDPQRTHGDLLLILQGPHRDVVTHAVRRLVRATGSGARIRWLLDVFLRPDTTKAPDRTSTRNLMGFKDGTANPDPTVDDLMADVVWSAGADDGEPTWCAGGSYLVARTLRMQVEAWDAETLDHQEKVFGRAKVSGAPLDGTKETDVPVYPKDPAGAKVPLTSHIRLANPRDGKARLMLRRSMSYSRGIDASGTLDQGLLFLSYQRTMSAFLEAQARLKGEPLEQFVITNGGGFFFAFPGPAQGGYVGQSMIESG
ncbi:Dyp-type peroxidase [Cumulibacter manganitolerans]|uniref:Dyp-type peroxidase n=1 Tax=Cumulibacter manganitolerans TaxID=1884992 RepID=UPI0012974146|nr:Dyp-type peroxidase [Cumulibacter manganitolerans]